MTPEILSALIAFAFVTSITPGPNNLMLMASGANFGLRRTVPHMLGIGIGFMVMVVGVGLGVMRLFEIWPAGQDALIVASVGYLLWLAWKIARAAPPEPGAAGGRPLTFLQAAGFQWVNPKAWAMALSAVGLYAPERDVPTILLLALILGLVNLPSVSLWAVLGRELRRFLTSPRRLRLFNRVMAFLLVLSLLPVLSA
ncbi:LysE family translocator [Halovulum dunhuangense]|uniref:LysE family translocator n=1 Tax=Halovulum dunhuangense TaxID=1505036 RepID=A0A849L650_9RHOB|nr:LysE family translocator [Halovulum dunhuangense]NNU81577.1 LysE family translocator [Halovulum dunhuangense]